MSDCSTGAALIQDLLGWTSGPSTPLGYSDVHESHWSSQSKPASPVLISPSVLLPQHVIQQDLFGGLWGSNLVISLCLSVCFQPLYYTNRWTNQRTLSSSSLSNHNSLTVWLFFFFFKEHCIFPSADFKCKLLWVIMTVTSTLAVSNYLSVQSRNMN